AFELRVLDRLKDLLEERAGLVALGDQVVAAHKGRRLDLLGRGFFEHAAGELVVRQVAVARKAVEAGKLQVLVERRHARKAQVGPPNVSLRMEVWRRPDALQGLDFR